MSNKSMGNHFEADFCEILRENGFWCHNMAMNQHGQPADVIAVKNGKSFLIDCKVCSTNRGFVFSRIEENQYYAMDYWSICGNGSGWFAILFGERIYMVSLDKIRMFKVIGHNSLTPKDILEVGVPIEGWVKNYANY